MTGFSTEPTALFGASAQVTAAADEGAATLTAIDSSADDLFGYGWTGPAASAFADGYAEWRRGAQLMLDALTQLSAALAAAGRAYAGAESATAAVVDRAQS